MEKMMRRKANFGWGARRGVALLLLLTLLTGLAPVALAGSNATLDAEGFKEVSEADFLSMNGSSVKTYLKLTQKTPVYEYPDVGTVYKNAASGSYVQLVAPKYVAYGGAHYVKVIFNNKPNDANLCMKAEDIYDAILSDSQVEKYITDNYWQKSSFDSLRKTDGLRGDIRVQALQYALYLAGFLSSEPDGSFGKSTEDAVKKFQKAKGLTVDGFAGNDTQTALFKYVKGEDSSVTPDPEDETQDGGSKASSITPSSPKVYVKLEGSTNAFKTDTKSSGIEIPAGSVLQLVANKYYTGSDGKQYMCLYYGSQRYNVRASDVSGCVMSTSALTNYVTGTLWKANSFISLNKPANLVGEVSVHSLQYALQLLGYYSGTMDGSFGDGTESAVKAYQRANGLVVDGRAGPATQAKLYAMALATYNNGNTGNILYASSGGNNNSNTNNNTSTGQTGVLTTTDSVNLRKTASTQAPRLEVVPRNTRLNYTSAVSAGGVTWYQVVYNGLAGWVMGTYVSVSGSGGSGGGSTGVVSGTVTIIMNNTRLRKTANGDKTGILLSMGSKLPYYSTTSAAGYTWYYVSTANGVNGYVRGDCVTASTSGGGNSGGGGGGGGGVLPSSTKTYLKTPIDVEVFVTAEKPNSGLITIPKGTVLQMVSPTTYTKNGEKYCSLYYNNNSYNAVYDDVEDGILSDTQLRNYITGTLWKQAYTTSLKEEMNLKGDVRVHGAQLALSVLGFYTGTLDGSFGSGTSSAVRNFQRQNSLSVDGSIGPATWVKLFPKALAAYNGGSWVDGGGDGGDTPIPAGDFGVVNSVEKASWTTVDGGSVSLFKRGTTAQVMDVQTGRVFTIYRWAGGNHADCVPYTSADTKTMCDIVGFPYNSSHPSSAQLSKIKGDANNSNATYTWPDFKGTLTSANSVGGDWDRRPAWLNVNGRVFCVSLYGWPHGFNGSDSFSLSKFSNGSYFYAQNNYYGMMCVHFVGSKTHTGSSVDSQHQAAIDTAYNSAKAKWPGKVK